MLNNLDVVVELNIIFLNFLNMKYSNNFVIAGLRSRYYWHYVRCFLRKTTFNLIEKSTLARGCIDCCKKRFIILLDCNLIGVSILDLLKYKTMFFVTDESSLHAYTF